jgi:hypothetical protein
MTETPVKYNVETVQGRILTLREQKVILDADLAAIYGVPTRALNQALKRNRDRFPADFVFQLTPEDMAVLTSPSAVSSSGIVDRPDGGGNRSQIVTGSQKHRDPRFRPYAFTEHGAIMAATVLNSPRAVEMSVFIVRAFVKMREQLLATTTLAKRLAEVEKLLLTHDSALRDLYQKIRPLLLPPPEPERKAIGFGVKERRAPYRVVRTPRP